jgi:FkbM family methyltransferase
MRSLGPYLQVELEPGLFIMPRSTSVVDVSIMREGAYERETLRAFAALLGRGMVVMDVGANVGQYTLVAAHRVGPEGQVHAFEPTPHLAEQVLRNLRLNALDNATVNAVAVSDAAGTAALHFVEPDDPGENSIVCASPGASSIEVPTITLDGYAAGHGLARVDVIKMDIEGAEPLALRGAAGLLSGGEAPVLVLELNPKTLAHAGTTPDEFLALLASFGYAFHTLAAYSVHTHDPYVNGLAFRPDHLSRFPALRGMGLNPMGTWVTPR